MDGAVAASVGVFDTARAYGNAESRIGAWTKARGITNDAVRIVTKVPAVPAGKAEDRARFVRDAIAASARALGQDRLDLVLAHRGEDLFDPAVLEAFAVAQNSGRLGAFGASVYAAQDAKRLIRESPIQALQVPVNLVDQRMASAGVLDAAQDAGVAVFARSVFLQGTLLLAPGQLPPYLSALEAPRRALEDLAREIGLSLHAMALAGVRDLPGISSLVIGVERAHQFAPHAAAMTTPPLSGDVMDQIAEIAAGLPEALIDPSRWPRVERPAARG